MDSLPMHGKLRVETVFIQICDTHVDLFKEYFVSQLRPPFPLN